MTAKYQDLPFTEAIAFFQQKISLPTQRWTDMWQGMHSRAFVVAGAMKQDLLTDLRKGIDDAISKGTTIEDFRKTFDEAVKKYGWSYNGERGWRTATIFNTNLKTAYAAGRYDQMTDPDVLAERPYWKYISGKHFGSADPRPEHDLWDNKTLPWNDVWWQTHEPPNGWGCNCEIVSMGKEEYDNLPKEQKTRPEGEKDTYPWKNPATGEIIDVPKGIDPGWAYSPGRTAYGERLPDDIMRQFKKENPQQWEPLIKSNWESYNRPERLLPDMPLAKPDYSIDASKPGIEKALKNIFGADEKVFSYINDDFRYDMRVSAEIFARHLAKDRVPYLPLLPETITAPQEVWLSFEQHKATGKVVLRMRIIKVMDVGKRKSVTVVTNAYKGLMEAWTVLPRPGEVNNLRVGKLLYSK